MKGVICFLFFTFLLPLELLTWGTALDSRFGQTYLAGRLRLSVFYDLPREVWVVLGVLAAVCILRGSLELNRSSHRCDVLIFCGFPLYMLSLYLIFDLPFAMAIGVGLIMLCEIAVWFACRPEGRPSFPLPDEQTGATPMQRVTAFFLLLGILFGAFLIFQEGYQLWLAFSWTPVLALLPLGGIFLPKVGQLREYLAGSLQALVAGAVIYSIGQIFTESTLRADWGIVTAYIFLELMTALMIRPLLPDFRNRSLLILAGGAVLTFLIMPEICNPWIVTLSMYVLYVLIDNRRAIRKKFLSLAGFHLPEVHRLSWAEYAAQAWGFGSLLAVCLAGPQSLWAVLTGLATLLAAGLIRSYLLNRMMSDHLVLRNFPYAPETLALLLSAMVCSCFAGSDTDGTSVRSALMILLSAYAAASCLMQLIWNVGGLVGHYTEDRPSLQIFNIICFAGISFLLTALFFFQAPAAILLGIFWILLGIFRIGRESFLKKDKNSGLTTGWVMILIGQFVFVSTSEVLLPEPKWSNQALVCAAAAFAALYIYRLYDYYIHQRRTPES